MKITKVEPFLVDGGWRPFIFVKVETDEGITGWGECTDPRSPNGVVGTIKDLTPTLIGRDPGAYEMRLWDMFRASRQSPGGIVAKAIAGIDCALLDVKAKALASPSPSYSVVRRGTPCESTGPTAAQAAPGIQTYWAPRPSGLWRISPILAGKSCGGDSRP